MSTDNKFKLHRVANNKSVSEVANYLSMSDGNYRKIEKGAIKMCLDNVYKLSKFYHVNLEQLIMEDDYNQITSKADTNVKSKKIVHLPDDLNVFSKLLSRDEELIKELKSEISLLKEVLKKTKDQNMLLRKENKALKQKAKTFSVKNN